MLSDIPFRQHLPFLLPLRKALGRRIITMYVSPAWPADHGRMACIQWLHPSVVLGDDC